MHSSQDGSDLVAGRIHGIPHAENRFGGCENSVASLIRELRLDHATGQLVSRPIAEYANLHTQAFVDKQLVPLPAVNGSATTLPIPHGQGGSLDSKSSAASSSGLLRSLKEALVF